MNTAHTRADVCTATAKPASKAAPLPYPEHPSSQMRDKAMFWLLAWMHQLAQYEAFCTYESTKTAKAFCANKPVLFDAICAAGFLLKDSLQITVECLVRAGGLLFAFPESTKFAGAVA